jgi:hypothetical protein
VQFIGEETVERPNAKDDTRLTLIAAAIIRLNSTETASLLPVSFGGPSITRLRAPRVYNRNPNSSISETMP